MDRLGREAQHSARYDPESSLASNEALLDVVARIVFPQLAHVRNHRAIRQNRLDTGFPIRWNLSLGTVAAW